MTELCKIAEDYKSDKCPEAPLISKEKVLAYYTVGHSRKYVDVMALSIKSLRHFNKDIDIWIIADESFVPEIESKIKDVTIFPRKDSPTPEIASMQKLSIFSQDVSAYSKIIYIDSDILIGIPLSTILDKVISDDKLYAYAETTNISDHNQIYWSLTNYDRSIIDYFRENNIYVFNAGLFAFKPSTYMKTHFSNILEMIRTHRGSFFYEQSFMNVYFNTKSLVDYSVFNKENYTMHASIHSPKETLLHFCGNPGDGGSKISRMSAYIQRSMPYLL